MLLVRVVLLVLIIVGTSFASDNALLYKSIMQKDVRVIVKLKDSATKSGLAESKQRALSALQNDVIKSNIPGKKTKVTKFKYVPGVALTADFGDLIRLMNDPRVEKVYEDIEMEPQLHESVHLLGVPTVWVTSAPPRMYDGTGTTVAVLDTGVYYHPFIAHKIVGEACYTTENDDCPNGREGPGSAQPPYHPTSTVPTHGTHVAGIVLGSSPSLNGVAKGANLFAVRVFNKNMKTYESSVIKALEHVYRVRSTYNIVSVNMSIAGAAYSEHCDFYGTWHIAELLRKASVAVVVATGNNGYSDKISFPSCLSNVVSVGATRKDNTLGAFSNTTTFTQLLAPGSNIYSAYGYNEYRYKTGTSMATPHVAGAWAVLKSKYPQATVEDVLNALKSTGTMVATKGGYSLPLINVAEADRRLQNTLSCTISISPNTINVPASGGTVTVTVTSDCNWRITSPLPAWLTLSRTSGTRGTTTITISVNNNTETTSRAVTLRIGSATLTIRQDALVCSYSFSSASISIPANSQNIALSLTAPTGCNWTLTSTVSWLRINGVTNGSGSTIVSLTVDTNSTSRLRRGNILINGNVGLTVEQAGTSTSTTCTNVTLLETERTYLAMASEWYIPVRPNSSTCTWTAYSPVSWVRFKSTTGVGNRNATIYIDRNTGPRRSAVLTIGNAKYYVTQEAGR